MRYLGRRLVHSWWCKAFLIVCVFFGCWNLLESLSSEDLRRTYNRFFTAREDWTKPDRVKLEALPSCSLRNNIMEENNLKTSFDFSVPLWQWRDSISLPLWQKLQYGSLPYGWKNQSYYEIEKTLALLSHPSNNRLFERREPNKCVRCAVVGNGGILNGSNQGEAIDKHDFVFRVNGAIIKGFEKDVGTKTSFYGFTTNSMKNSLIGYYEDGFHQVPQGKGIQYILIPAELRDYLMVAAAIKGVRVPYGPDEGDSPFEYFGNDLEAYQFKMIHPAFIHYVTQRFLNSYQLYEYADVYMPSTGAMMLLIALHSCDQVSAFGFITDNFQQFSDHYYEREYKPLIFYANHDIQMEGELWKKLHNHKVMWLYQR